MNTTTRGTAASIVLIASLAATGALFALDTVHPAPAAAACPSSMTFVVGGTGDPTGVNAPGVPPTVDNNARSNGLRPP